MEEDKNIINMIKKMLRRPEGSVRTKITKNKEMTRMQRTRIKKMMKLRRTRRPGRRISTRRPMTTSLLPEVNVEEEEAAEGEEDEHKARQEEDKEDAVVEVRAASTNQGMQTLDLHDTMTGPCHVNMLQIIHHQ